MLGFGVLSLEGFGVWGFQKFSRSFLEFNFFMLFAMI